MFYAHSIREFMEFSCFTLPKYLKTYIVCSKRSFPWSFFCWFSPFFVFDVVILGMCFWSKWCRFCFQYNAKKVLRKRKHFRKWDCRRKRLFCGFFFLLHMSVSVVVVVVVLYVIENLWCCLWTVMITYGIDLYACAHDESLFSNKNQVTRKPYQNFVCVKYCAC